MGSPIPAYFHICIKTKLLILFLPTTYLLVLFINKPQFTEDTNQEFSSIPSFCLVSHMVQETFKLKNQQSLNPPKFVDEIFIDYVTFKHDVCVKSSNTDKLAIILVHSARDHFEGRNIIRKTYASIKRYKNWQVVTLFLMGQSEYCLNMTGNLNTVENVSKEEELLKGEHSEFGDTIIGTFTDTYHNLTYKHLMGYKFVLERCSEVDWVIKTDDDMFVDITQILDQRNEEIGNFSKSGNNSVESPADIYCHQYYTKPSRCRECNEGKWYVTKEEWPEEEYPHFCLGNDYAISRVWMENIYSVMKPAGFFWIDDVFVTGKLRILAEKKFKEVAKIRNIRASVTDSRGERGYILENCRNRTVKFGMFVFIRRSTFAKYEMECLWESSMKNVSPTEIA